MADRGTTTAQGDSVLKAVEILVQEKSDTDLLKAICAALSDNDADLIAKLMSATNYDQRAATNIQIVNSIVSLVNGRTEQA